MLFQEISTPTLRKIVGNSEMVGVQKLKSLRESMKLNCNFQRGFLFGRSVGSVTSCCLGEGHVWEGSQNSSPPPPPRVKETEVERAAKIKLRRSMDIFCNNICTTIQLKIITCFFHGLLITDWYYNKDQLVHCKNVNI